MNGKIAVVLLSGLLAACAQTPPPAASAPPPPPPPAPEGATLAEAASANRVVIIRGARCGNLVTLTSEDQIAAAMFYVGYQSSRSGARTINIGAIPNIISAALTDCNANPERTVAAAFARAYASARSRR